MKIHYNNGKEEKIIDNVMYIQVYDRQTPFFTVCLRNGRELTINPDRVEGILDDNLTEPPKEVSE